MRCPTCHGKTRVIDTTKKKICIVRRRECRACGRRFNTIEIIDKDST